jgi:heme exporter protein D
MLEALDMGKHALYVWGSFAMTAFCMIVEPLWLRSRTKQIHKRLARMVRLEQEVSS